MRKFSDLTLAFHRQLIRGTYPPYVETNCGDFAKFVRSDNPV